MTAQMLSALYAIARSSVCSYVCHTSGSVKNDLSYDYEIITTW